jgi:uncharacterized protein (DUF1697 family)
MGIFVALLRGINVSGQKMIKMDALKQSLSKLELKNVATYVQSGNVVFQSEMQALELSQIIKKVILQDFGFEVPILVFSISTWERILTQNPFNKETVIDQGALYFVLFTDLPKMFYIGENVVYLNIPNGFGNTKLNNNFFESKLKIEASTRNWKTAYQLLEMAKSIA